MTYQKPTVSAGVQALGVILGTQDKGNPPGDGQCGTNLFCAGHELDD